MQNLFFILSAVLVLAFSRWMAHAPNFTPVLAMALWLGSQKLPKWTAAAILMGSLLLSDWLIGFHDLMLVVYGSLLAVLWGSKALQNKTYFTKTNLISNGSSWVFGGLFASVFFFITTNLAVWWTSGMYPHTNAGLMECFVMALPFFHNTLLSTWIFSLLLLSTSQALGFSNSRELELSKY